MKSSQCLSTAITYLNVFKLSKIFSEFFNWTTLWFSSVQSLSRIRLFVTPWTAARQPPCPSPTPRVHPKPHVH